MKTKIVTALFDIGRENFDGRKISDYMEWFKKTLALNADIIIYTEQKFAEIIPGLTDSPIEIIVQDFGSIPAFKYRKDFEYILESMSFLSNMLDLSRIECNLPDYNLIQYSKFGWLVDASTRFSADRYFWMDAGCSRFFGDADSGNPWPKRKTDNSKIIIQGNIHFDKYKNALDSEYIWNNECMLVGTLFGGGKAAISKLYDEVEAAISFMLGNRCINNEQFALALAYKKNPDLFDIHIDLDGTHLPLFKYLSYES